MKNDHAEASGRNMAEERIVDLTKHTPDAAEYIKSMRMMGALTYCRIAWVERIVLLSGFNAILRAGSHTYFDMLQL